MVFCPNVAMIDEAERIPAADLLPPTLSAPETMMAGLPVDTRSDDTLVVPLAHRSTDSLALSQIQEILSAVAHGEPQEAILNLLVEKVCLMTHSASAAIALLDMPAPGSINEKATAETVTFVAVAGEEADDLMGTRVRIADTVAGTTAQTGEVFFSFRPTKQPIEGVLRVKSALVVPIYDDKLPIGSLAALDKEQNLPFDGHDLLTLTTLATAASVVVGSARLRRTEQRQGRELAMLNEALRHVSEQHTAQDVLQAVVTQCGRHIENYGIVTFLCNDERTHLYIAQESGLSEEEREITLPADSGVGQMLLTATRPVALHFTDDRTTLPSPIANTETITCEPIFLRPGVRSALAAPMRGGDLAQGVVLVLSGHPADDFTPAETNLLFALSAQAAVALDNARLFEDATQRAEEATALYELSQAVTSTLQLPEILERVSSAILSLLAVDKFALFLKERHTDRLELVVERNLPEGASERLRPRVGEGIIGWVMEFETPTAVRDITADHRNAAAPLHLEGAVSLIAMPLQIGTATIGVLAALSSRRRLFTVAEMELLYTIANQAAIAIENARIYTSVRQKSSELRRFFNRVGRALAVSNNPQSVPELIASLTQEVMEADRCALHAVRRGSDGLFRMEEAASVGFRVEASQASQVVSAASPTGWVVQQAHSLTIEDLPDDPRFSGGYERPVRGEVMSYLGVPLRGTNGVIGVLEVYTRERRTWDSDEVRLLLTFAAQAAVAFQNARLAQESERGERMARLLERLLDMATRTTPPEAEEVVAALALGLNAPIITLYREKDGWRQGIVSSPLDAALLDALWQTVAGNTAGSDDFQWTIAPGGNIAVAVMVSASLYSYSLVLENAANLLSRRENTV